MPEAYELVVAEATAAEFHARAVPDPARQQIWWHRITRPALVLGSTQSDDVADGDACRTAGVEIVRRRSGGGAVLLVPGEMTWIDVIVPRGAAGWADDVHAQMVWLGRHLATAFAERGVESVAVHDGKLHATDWSSVVCFDGVGPGEVLVGGQKLVGVSQRRTRGWARLQCCWYSRHDHADLAALLAEETRPTPRDLGSVATLPHAIGDTVPHRLAGILET